MLSPRERRRFTAEEYLQLEVTSENRSEYYDGEIFLMTGGSLNHNQILMNLVSAVRQALPKECRAFSSDVRLLVERHTLFTYPDLLVVCGPLHRMPARSDTLTDARLIVEVLSPTTEVYDRTDKFRMYTALPSLEEYAVIAQDRHHGETWRRQLGNEWTWKAELDPGSPLELQSVGVKIPLEAIYADLPDPF